MQILIGAATSRACCSYPWFYISAGQLSGRGTQLRHTANPHKVRQVFKIAYSESMAMQGSCLNPWERSNSWSGNHCIMSMSADKQKAALNPSKADLILGSLSAVQLSQDGQRQSMSWGQQENQEQEIFYPCQLHQVFVHVILILASVKERNDVPSSVKESFRFRHWTESWTLLCDHHCSAAHLGRVCTLLDFQTISTSLHGCRDSSTKGTERNPDRGLIFMTCRFRYGKVI